MLVVTCHNAVTSKLEEGNFKAAIRLICSDDRPATDSPETLATLRGAGTVLEMGGH